ncbi:MAG: methyltransferase domain-containing protein [Devosia sp.]|jgi:SAM-dependent methyltransferase|uniref:methyltransferase domain-containing protein n=1 Tax=unclassified Devosia TaxID=196773 RepID=UPI0019EDD631|nr:MULTISPECIES: methyltransferase domain-containing protein [unclassified Devosia]MBF0679082.1 methyltransferase domain-containing protein [Devosia sp.]WEJ33697.1 methyltransferase domain-containing protein [Devosia sp. SD17-2]
MTSDVSRLIAFYRSPLGRISRTLVRENVIALAGDLGGKRVMGLGFATPYMRFALERAERVLAFMPARQGASAWPREGPSHTVLCDPLEMPLTDSAVDLTIAVHALEHVADAEELMRELWRITAPNGHLLLVVPRRRGIWAQRDDNPFGQGNPYSAGQLEKLLRDHSFVPEAWRDALFVPPVRMSLVLRSTRLFERMGRLFGPAMSGVICVRARKEAFPAIPRRKRAERFVRLPGLATAPAHRTGLAPVDSPLPHR